MASRAYFSVDEHDRDDAPWPLQADAWFWQTGNRWVAVCADFHEDWWEGSDPEDIAARPDSFKRPIWDVPKDGVLIYLTAEGEMVETRAPRGEDDEWWVLDAENESNKIGEAATATGLPLVGIVSPEGGVVAYAVADLADEIVNALNQARS